MIKQMLVMLNRPRHLIYQKVNPIHVPNILGFCYTSWREPSRGLCMNMIPPVHYSCRTNVALKGKIEASSTPEWYSSMQNKLLNGNAEQDFGLHTDVELNPFCVIDINRSMPLDSIYIHGRNDGVRPETIHILVHVSTDAEKWVSLYDGNSYIGSEKNGRHLAINTAGFFWARFIKITRCDRSALVLSQVEIFVQNRNIYLMDFRERNGLDISMLNEFHNSNEYTSYSMRTVGADKETLPTALEIYESGAFGNCLLQYATAFMLAKKLNISTIILSSRDRSSLVTPGESFLIDGILFADKNLFNDSGHNVLCGQFFDFSQLNFSATEFTPSAVSRFTKEFVRLAMPSIRLKDRDQCWSDILSIHIRSGDIFSTWVDPNYVQPPLSFYTKIIKRLRDERKIRSVMLVYENRMNPVIEILEQYLLKNLIPYTVQSGKLNEDINALISQKYLAFGFGTFGLGICMLSEKIDTVFCFSSGFSQGYEFLETVDKYVETIDKDGRYIRPGEWDNSETQRFAMINYPEKSLSFVG